MDRQVGKEVDWSSIKKLNTIGIDEIALKKGHDSYVMATGHKSKYVNIPANF